MKVLRVATSGNVDDGKSTLIGRLLWDSKALYNDQIASLQAATLGRGETGVNLAYVTDGLRAERDGGITIDVAYTYFSTNQTKFIIADCPGHIQYTQNFVTGLSNSNTALILVDATKPLNEQTQRHLLYALLMKTPYIVICVNKMDAIVYSKKIFHEIQERLIQQFQLQDNDSISFIPISAINGENVMSRSMAMGWYKGPCLMDHLDNLSVASLKNSLELRITTQSVVKTETFNGLACRIVAGTLRKGDELTENPNGPSGTVTRIFHSGDTEIAEAEAGRSVMIELSHEIGAVRGTLLHRKNPDSYPQSASSQKAILITFRDFSGFDKENFDLRLPQKTVGVKIKELHDFFDFQKMKYEPATGKMISNTSYKVTLETTENISYDSFEKSQATGFFSLTHSFSGDVLAAGLFL